MKGYERKNVIFDSYGNLCIEQRGVCGRLG